MCIAIVKPTHKTISKKRLATCFINNPHGAGFCYYDDKEVLQIRKGFFKLNDFYEAYKAAGEHRYMMIHFRIKTVGSQNATNCHPFSLERGVSALMHNGTIENINAEGGLSDSGTLALWLRLLESKTGHWLWENDAGLKMLDALVKPSRVAIMTPKECIMLNEKAWIEDDGVFYSNHHFRSIKAKYLPSKSKANTTVVSHNFSLGCEKIDYAQKPVRDKGLCTFTSTVPSHKNPSVSDVYPFARQMKRKLKKALDFCAEYHNRPENYRLASDFIRTCKAVSSNPYNLTDQDNMLIRREMIQWLSMNGYGKANIIGRVSTIDLMMLGLGNKKYLQDIINDNIERSKRIELTTSK